MGEPLIPMASADDVATAPQPHAERLARGAVLQQGAQVIRMAGGLLVLTVLARELTFSELGTYAILLSLIAYVQFVKASVMNGVVVGVAEAGDDPERLGRIVSSAFAVYVVLGVASGAALAGIGLAALPVLNVPPELEGSARAGVIGLAAVTALGWPVQVFDDLLRGLQRFAAVSVLEISAMVAYVGGALALVASSSPVWMLVTWNAAIPMLTGLLCLAGLARIDVRVRLSRHLIDREEARRLGSVSGLLVLGGVADLATYSLDRAILSVLRSPATVGRYEGPLQSQNAIRYLHGVLSAPVMPAAARYLAQDDRARLRELFLRGLRYTLAITCPFVVVFTVLAGPVMTAWLGERFAGVAGAATLFCAWWYIGAHGGVVGTFLIAARRFRFLAGVAWAGAVVNLALTLALTPTIGLYGPIVGAIGGFAVALAWMLPAATRIAGVRVRDLAREAWLPAYSVAAIVGVTLLAVDRATDLSGAGAVLAALVAVPLAYWALFAALWLRADERVLARRTLAGLVPRRRPGRRGDEQPAPSTLGL